MKNKRDISGSKNPNWKGGKVSYKCEECGAHSQAKRASGKKRFCSLVCANKWQSKNPYRRPETIVRLEKDCIWCGLTMKLSPSRAKRKKFCSSNCHNEWRSFRMSLSRNPNWRNGASKEKYPQSYYVIRNLALQRDDSLCQNPKCNQETDTINVHHINYDKQNCELSNLITLCASCNGKANFQRPLYTKYFQSILSKRYGYKYLSKTKMEESL